MSERYCAWIRIGGRIERAKVEPLLEEIRRNGVKLDWCQPPFEPAGPDELLAARSDGWLWLCDEEARYGEFTELEELCRKLGLSYRRHSEAWCGEDAVLVDWRPGMKEPLVQRSSTEHTDAVLVLEEEVRRALTALETGKTKEAIHQLKKLCSDLPELPLFELV